MTTWFITGTSSGFGRLVTQQLVERGDSVAATLRRTGALDDLRATAGERLWVTELDVTRPEDVQNKVEGAFQYFGTIDVILNNAGYGLLAAAEEGSRAQIVRMVETNLLGSIDVIRAALPLLRAQGHGRIIQVSSAGGQTTYPGFSAYHASKWGIEGYCETLAKEVAPFGIGVTIVEPGATPTNFSSSADSADPMSEYETGPIGDLRRSVADGSFNPANDPVALARAIIASVDDAEAPLRLTLGDDAFHDIRADYVRRLERLDEQRELALSVAPNTA